MAYYSIFLAILATAGQKTLMLCCNAKLFCSSSLYEQIAPPEGFIPLRMILRRRVSSEGLV
jgi:hypothetical protein